mgnify:CR=1 FL=1
MENKISIYGLSGSGKSCYIYAMTQAMRKGIKFANGNVLTVINSNIAQVNLLNSRFSQMTKGVWPPGTTQTTEYTYGSKLAFKAISDVVIRDYRGGIFTSIDKDDQEEVNELYKSFKDSASLAFFIGVDMVMRAMNNDVDAYNDLGIMQTLYAQFLEQYPEDKTPILFVLTKSDLASPQQLEKCKNFIKEEFQAFFGTGTALTVGLTAVTLGDNLSCGEDNQLLGVLKVEPTDGNIQIPILYTLYCVFSRRIMNELAKNKEYASYLKQNQIDLEKEKKRGFFDKIFNGKEKTVRASILSNQAALDNSKKNLLYLNDTIELIKTKLNSGIEIYDDGQLIQL